MNVTHELILPDPGNGRTEHQTTFFISLCRAQKKSARYGKTESLGGGGKYRFKGTDICSDVLEGIFKTP